MIKKKKLKKAFVNIVLFCSVMLICLLSVEAAIRLFNIQTGVPSWPQEKAIFVSGLKKNIYANLQNLTKSTSEYSYTVSTNDYGFRDFHDFKKKEGTSRIVGIGSSSMFGNTVNVNETYLSLLGENLGLEVINLGLGGSGFGEMNFILQEYGLLYKPDLVIIDAAQGNFYASYLFEKRDYQPRTTSLYLYAYEHSKLLNFLYWRIKTTPLGFKFINSLGFNRHAQNSNAFDLDLLQHKNSEPIEISKKAVFKNIKEMKEIFDKNNIPLLIVYMPASYHINNEKWEQIIKEYNLDATKVDVTVPQKFYKAIAEKLNIPFFDPTEELKIHPQSQDLYWKYDGHFNKEGTRIYTSLLAEYIKEQNLMGVAS